MTRAASLANSFLTPGVHQVQLWAHVVGLSSTQLNSTQLSGNTSAMCGTFTSVVPLGRLRIGSASGCGLLTGTVVGGIVAVLQGTHDSKPQFAGAQMSMNPSLYCRKTARGFNDDAYSLNTVLSRTVRGNECSSVHGVKSVDTERSCGPNLKNIVFYGRIMV